MPEGPEVTITAQYLLDKLRNKIISNINIISGKYTHKKLDGLDLFEGNKFTIINIDSKGKLLWYVLENIKTSNIVYIISHFGLTGQWSFYSSSSDRITFDILDKKNNKKHKLYYSDTRNFGFIIFTDKKNVLNQKLNKLSPDFLKTVFDCNIFKIWVNDFRNKTEKKYNMILGKILMEQDVGKGIGSGIGNYLCCEILYRAELSPYRTIGSLTDEDIKNLCYWIKYTIKLAYYNNYIDYIKNISDTFIDSHKDGIISGKYPNYHTDIILKQNAKFKFLVYRKKEDKYGNIVYADKAINKGRTTYWVKSLQK
jgi:formamidopyrimidine-DNA glycosylase